MLQCSINASWPSSAGARAARRRALRAKLPKPLPPGKYDIGQVLCQGEAQGCALLGSNIETSHAAAWWKQTYTCEQGMQCRCSTSSEADAACTFLDNPNYGMSSFDAAPWALITM